MFQTMPKPINSEGGGKVKTGVESFNYATEYQIDTGLGNNLKRFVGYGRPSGNANVSQYIEWDADNPTKFNAAYINTGGGNGYSNATFVSTSQSMIIVVKDVTNGVVTLLTGNHSGVSPLDPFVWYAE